jgi:hypothetical protein
LEHVTFSILIELISISAFHVALRPAAQDVKKVICGLSWMGSSTQWSRVGFAWLGVKDCWGFVRGIWFVLVGFAGAVSIGAMRFRV